MMRGRKRSKAGGASKGSDASLPPPPPLPPPAKELDENCEVQEGAPTKHSMRRRRRPSNAGSSTSFGSSSNGNGHDSINSQLNIDAQDVMRANLDLMREVVMRIREDEDFAKSIYADCPRLQHLLDQHPDLRPIFEDPNLVRINFEQVYRDHGGVLPEDQPKKPSLLARIVQHPLFKVVKFLLLIKKIVNCIVGGGFSMARNCITGCFQTVCCIDDVPDLDVDNMDGGGDAAGSANEANRVALNNAADHMEQPEVQDKMNELLEQNDNEALQEAIDNDKELSALRDSNPLCAELMSDPEGMKILTNPDNLRALGDCPDLIEQDFADPDWQPPDIENNNYEPGSGSGGTPLDTLPEVDGDLEADLDGDGDVDADDEAMIEQQESMGGDADAEDGGMDDFEMGDGGDDNNNSNAANRSNSKRAAPKKDQQNRQGNGGGGGFFANLGAGLTDYMAGELVGFSVGDIMGGGDPTDGLESAAADQASGAASQMENVAATSDMLLNEDVVDNLEGGMDNLEDSADAVDRDAAGGGSNAGLAAGAAAGGAAAVAVAGGAVAYTRRNVNAGDDEGSLDLEAEEGADREEPVKKTGRMAWAGNFVTAVKTAAKEQVAGAFLGNDLAEMLVERIEEKDEEKGSNDRADEKDEEKKVKGKGFFRRPR